MAQINVNKVTTPTNSPTGKLGLFADSIDGVFKQVDENGNVENIGLSNEIQFGRTITEDTTIIADDLFKLVTINSAIDVNITVDNMTIGSWIPFDTVGAGLPEFQIGGVNLFPDDDFTGATSFILVRKEDVGGLPVYDIKYK